VRTANNHPPGWSAVVKLKLKAKHLLGDLTRIAVVGYTSNVGDLRVKNIN